MAGLAAEKEAELRSNVAQAQVAYNAAKERFEGLNDARTLLHQEILALGKAKTIEEVQTFIEKAKPPGLTGRP